MINPAKKAKLRWQCRRGMLELDLILLRFVEQQLDHLSEQQLVDFEVLLNHPDPELLNWLMGYEIPCDKELKDIVELIKLSAPIS